MQPFSGINMSCISFNAQMVSHTADYWETSQRYRLKVKCINKRDKNSRRKCLSYVNLQNSKHAVSGTHITNRSVRMDRSSLTSSQMTISGMCVGKNIIEVPPLTKIATGSCRNSNQDGTVRVARAVPSLAVFASAPSAIGAQGQQS